MKRENLLLMAALLGMGAHAAAEDATPPQINVVVIDETDRGFERGILDRYGIASRASRFSRGPQLEALRQVMGGQDVRMRLVVPTGCPAASTRDECRTVRRVKDLDLPDVIRETRNSTLLVLWPEAAYFAREKMYAAYLDVDVLENGKVVPGPFYVGYRDWKCDIDCVSTAFEASAKELSAMVRHVLDMGPAAQTRSVPAAWQNKPAVTSMPKWANDCAAEYDTYRVVREYGERLWLNDPTARTLLSAAWRGCNIL